MSVLKPAKRCFVTVGATASFTSLVRAVLDPAFLEALHEHAYTELRVQYGKDGKKLFEDLVWMMADDPEKRLGLTISGFDFKQEGLQAEMLLAKKVYGRDGNKGDLNGIEGCVISHAGSGSVLDALRIELPIVVVPNSDLLHNHQQELAEALAEQNYVVHGNLDNLKDTLTEIEQLRLKMKAWPPVTGRNEKTPRQTLTQVLDDELGYD